MVICWFSDQFPTKAFCLLLLFFVFVLLFGRTPPNAKKPAGTANILHERTFPTFVQNSLHSTWLFHINETVLTIFKSE